MVSEGFSTIEGWLPVFVTGTAYTTNVPQTLNAGADVVSQVIPIGQLYAPNIQHRFNRKSNPVEGLTIGAHGLVVRIQIVGSGEEDVTFEIFPRDAHDADVSETTIKNQQFSSAFQVEDPVLGAVYAKGATTPYNQQFIAFTEEIGFACNLKFIRAAGTGNMTVSAWIKRFRRYS